MKIEYKFVNETKEIEVADDIGTIVKDFDRQEYNNDKKETRRHSSIDSGLDCGLVADTRVDIVRDLLRKDERKMLYKALETLNEKQKDLVNRVFFNAIPLKDIAAEYGVSYQAIQDRLEKILKKLRKNF